ncbi:MAG: ABC transporter ATP-binding protein [Firmicutes bacterium]|nr:ABC transporter ATP-binding protein [Bacillota bacterium]MBQ5961170.1 ABC transporter ATP-binding protein [Bacillota bacterium]
MNSILQVENVSFSYQNKYQTVHAVKKADCSFEQGKAYAIVGKSGSGKTTLLSLLAGLELPWDGRILFRGQDTRKIDRDAYRRDNAAVIYQNYNLFPLLTVIENVLYSMNLKGVRGPEARERAEKELLAVGIAKDQFRRYPPQLSGGEQQRVAIARALAAGNELILADEPTGNLDEGNSAQVVDILLRLAHEDGRCVIIITHDLEIAAQMDQVYLMQDGVLEEEESHEH